MYVQPDIISCQKTKLPDTILIHEHCMLLKSLSSHGYKVLKKQRTSKQASERGREGEREGRREGGKVSKQTQPCNIPVRYVELLNPFYKQVNQTQYGNMVWSSPPGKLTKHNQEQRETKEYLPCLPPTLHTKPHFKNTET